MDGHDYNCRRAWEFALSDGLAFKLRQYFYSLYVTQFHTGLPGFCTSFFNGGMRGAVLPYLLAVL